MIPNLRVQQGKRRRDGCGTCLLPFVLRANPGFLHAVVGPGVKRYPGRLDLVLAANPLSALVGLKSLGL
jgi:hypothetical protein